MLRKPATRRPVAVALIVLGGVLIYLAPEIWAGVALLVLGVLLELAGVMLERRT